MQSLLRRSLLQVSRKTYATETAGKLVVNFSVPFKAYMQNTVLTQVNLSSTDGDMGILAGHVPVVLELKPSVLTLIGATETTKYFVSGGFAIVNPDSSLNINAVEAVPLDELDQEG
ncbi:delta subunit of the central stalk of mitochondrial F1F0 ATP synthase, atp16 [Kappamyces sp. JEL0829]|nr:delta subunit of the central stalk of mitochondrial F1F0 ATP synthase, atp16 [Kappamyces sp. JEL0829]